MLLDVDVVGWMLHSKFKRYGWVIDWFVVRLISYESMFDWCVWLLDRPPFEYGVCGWCDCLCSSLIDLTRPCTAALNHVLGIRVRLLICVSVLLIELVESFDIVWRIDTCEFSVWNDCDLKLNMMSELMCLSAYQDCGDGDTQTGNARNGSGRFHNGVRNEKLHWNMSVWNTVWTSHSPVCEAQTGVLYEMLHCSGSFRTPSCKTGFC